MPSRHEAPHEEHKAWVRYSAWFLGWYPQDIEAALKVSSEITKKRSPGYYHVMTAMWLLAVLAVMGVDAISTLILDGLSIQSNALNLLVYPAVAVTGAGLIYSNIRASREPLPPGITDGSSQDRDAGNGREYALVNPTLLGGIAALALLFRAVHGH